MSVIQDPTGAHFCLWQGNQTPGIGIAGEDNTFCWADLMTPDRDAAKKFYSGLFGWTLTPGEGKDESGYLHITNGGADDWRHAAFGGDAAGHDAALVDLLPGQ